MKETPLLMCGPMVVSTLDGRKTQTRRIVKPQPTVKCQAFEWFPSFERFLPCDFLDGRAVAKDRIGPKCPYGQPGDHLWVKENFRLWDHDFETVEVEYMDGGSKLVPMDRGTKPKNLHARNRAGVKLKRPSIHMFRWASRITLEIVSVRVERVQGISREDALAEGLPFNNHCWKDEWRELWDSINADRDEGKYSWAKNPWVWVITFKKL